MHQPDALLAGAVIKAAAREQLVLSWSLFSKRTLSLMAIRTVRGVLSTCNRENAPVALTRCHFG